MKKISLPVLLTVMALFLMSPLLALTTAQADCMLLLDNGDEKINVADNSFYDRDAREGVIIFLGELGTWDVNVATGIGYPKVGSQSLPYLDLNHITLKSGAEGSLTVMFTQDHCNNTGTLPVAMGISGTTRGTVTYEAFFKDGNSPFDISGQKIGSLGDFNGAFQGETSGAITPDSDFTLTQVITIHHGASGDLSLPTSYDARLVVAPVPLALLLMGTGLLGLAGLGWRRRKKQG